LGLCFACSVTVSVMAAETEPKAGIEAGTVAPARSGVLTGLGESALSRTYPEAAVWLNLDDDDRVLGLLFAERTLPAKGALMILPEVGETAASGIAGSLAQRLADKGWAVLTVGLEAPSSSLRTLLERKPDVPKAASETGTGDAASVEVDVRVDNPAGEREVVYRERIQKTLQAGLTTLVSRGYENPALLAVGRASNYITDMPPAGQDLRAMIWVAPAFYPRDQARLVRDLGARSVPAVLELYDSQLASHPSGKQRAVMLHQAEVTDYERQPVALSYPPSIQGAPALANRIDAWLLSR